MNFKAAILAATALVLTALPASAATQPLQDRVEVTFVLDTTGSMADLIDGAKRKIWSIASTIVDSNPDADIAMALVAYRDIGDEYVLKTTEMSEDIQGLYGKLTKLEADGGNDTPESVNAALDKAVTGIKWTRGEHVKRIVFLVGDAPPHMDYQHDRKYKAILKDAAQRKIIVNTVQAGDMAETPPVWKEIAQYGHGRYMAIPQSGGEIVVIVTPYDDEILELQGALDGTIIPYGSDEMRDGLEQKMREKSAAAPSVKLDNSSYYSKRKLKKEVVTGNGDLIGDARNGRVDVAGLPESDLPKDIRALPKSERQAWVAGKIEERSKIEAKIAALVAQRDAFVAAERGKTREAANVDSFDRAVEDTLRSQLN